MRSLTAGNIIFGLSRETPIAIFTVEHVDDTYAYCRDAVFYRNYDRFISYKKESKKLIGVTKCIPFKDEDSAMGSSLYKTYLARRAREFCNLFDYGGLSEDDVIAVKEFLVNLKDKQNNAL